MQSPFLTIWTSPRHTLRALLSTNPGYCVITLACLSGVGNALDRFSMRNVGDRMSLGVILGLALVVGPLGGLISLWLGSHLIRFTGRLLKGAGIREHIKTALAWAAVPSICALPLWIPQLLLFGPEMFREEMPTLDANPGLWVPLIVTAGAEMIMGAWSFVLVCNTVAEAQGFRSAWRGLLNLVLATALVLVPLLLLFLVLRLITG